MINKKGEIIRFIRNNRKASSGDIMNKFGYGGYTATLIRTLKEDNIIEEKMYECGHCKYWKIKK